MITNKISEFKIIGISVRTTNQNDQATKDIPFLWNKFFEENIASKIPGKLGDEIYCVYTDYVKDHTQPYTTIIGCKVNNFQPVPGGLIGKTIFSGNYTSCIAKGKMEDMIVYKEWIKIWNSDIDRAYTTDFEIYGQKAQDPENAEVEIFIALN